jgi:hypothetical protein
MLSAVDADFNFFVLLHERMRTLFFILCFSVVFHTSTLKVLDCNINGFFIRFNGYRMSDLTLSGF